MNLNIKKREAVFVLTFIGVFLCTHAVYYYFKPQIKTVFVDKLTVPPSVKLINTITPGEQARQADSNINGSSASIKIAEGCDGADGMIILLAAMLAFPMALPKKIVGVISGLLVVYLVNIIRICGLYYMVGFNPDWFDFMHIYVGQFMVIFAGGVFFFLYIGGLTKKVRETS